MLALPRVEVALFGASLAGWWEGSADVMLAGIVGILVIEVIRRM